jgi:hypothetical protein
LRSSRKAHLKLTNPGAFPAAPIVPKRFTCVIAHGGEETPDIFLSFLWTIILVSPSHSRATGLPGMGHPALRIPGYRLSGLPGYRGDGGGSWGTSVSPNIEPYLDF